jgi:hypothetical protein
MGGTPSKEISFFIPNREDSQELLAHAELNDNYRFKCKLSVPNVIARAGQAYISSSRGAPSPPTLPSKCPTWLARGLPSSIPIIMMDATADGGMPHTRPHVICVSESTRGKVDNKTLLHELIHLHQRQPSNIVKWYAVYKDAFDMEPWFGELPDELEAQRRVNPDTIMCPNWIWKGKWVAVPVYLNKYNPVLNEIRVYFYDVHESKWQSYPPIEWVNYFGMMDDSLYEHPHEMAAYWLSDESRSPSSGSPVHANFNNAMKTWFIENK